MEAAFGSISERVETVEQVVETIKQVVADVGNDLVHLLPTDASGQDDSDCLLSVAAAHILVYERHAGDSSRASRLANERRFA